MTTTTVSTTDAAWAAVKAAAPGDTIILAAGKYGTLTVAGLVKAAPAVTLKAAAGAVVAAIAFDNAQNVVFDGFEVAVADLTTGHYGMSGIGASSVTLKNLKVHSASGAADGVGCFLRNTADITITGCLFADLGVAIGLLDSVRTTVSATEITRMGSDGIDVAGSHNTVLDGVTVHDLTPTIDPGGGVTVHPDAFQFWGSAANPLGKDNIVRRCGYIRGASPATLKSGFGGMAQGVFAESQQNLQVIDTAVVGTLANGISFSTCVGGLVQGCLVLGYPDQGNRIIFRGGSTNIAAVNNTANMEVVLLKQTGEAPTQGCTFSGTKLVAVPAQGDATAYNAFMAALSAGTTPTPPPVVAPPPVDPHLAQIADLQNQLAAAQGTSASWAKKASDAQALATTLQGKVTGAVGILTA